jgi:predicted NBD/HSP70 family sugar kinase
MKLFLKDIEEFNVQNRQFAQKRKIVSLLNKSEQPLTIPSICQRVKLSIPTGTKLINELFEDGVIVEAGKLETESGRRPLLYRVDPGYAYAIGVVILLKGISFSIFNLSMEKVFGCEKSSFVLENTPECLEEVIAFFRESLDRSGIPERRILGMGIGITGRVNSHTGHSFNYFDFPENPLAAYIGKQFSFPVYLDNDTRVSGLAEQVFGQARERKNAFVVNLSRGLGLVIISNGEIVEGEESFAGEFGHIQFGDSDRLCLCGKRGCLGTEVSGYALEQNFREQTAAGEVSLLSGTPENRLPGIPQSGHSGSLGNNGSVQYGEILEAALGGDVLSISLVHQIGFRLGKALGSMINLLNPGMIIIGGTFGTAGEILADAIKAGMRHTGLMLPLRSCELIFSTLGSDAAVKGAGAMVLRKLKLI